MAETGTKLDPAAEHAAASEPRLASDETKQLTTDVTEASKGEEAAAAAAAAAAGVGEGSKDSSTEKAPATSITGKAASAATTATSAVKDNVFSMFGGGPKKEKAKEQDDEGVNEPSGSSKAKDKAQEGEVNLPIQRQIPGRHRDGDPRNRTVHHQIWAMIIFANSLTIYRMTKNPNLPKCTSNPSTS